MHCQLQSTLNSLADIAKSRLQRSKNRLGAAANALADTTARAYLGCSKSRSLPVRF
jgi:hypothetical protein